MPNIAEFKELQGVSFNLYTPDEVKKLAVVEINQTKRVGPNTIYDVRMGPLTTRDACVTCKQSSTQCSGHYGYISLASPIYHPLVFNRLVTLLTLICVKCYRCIFTEAKSFETQLKRLKRINHCHHADCGLEQPIIKSNLTEQTITFIVDSEERLMTPAQIYFILCNVSEDEKKNAGVSCSLKGFVIFNLLVLPNAARPILKVGALVCDDDLTLQYIDIIKLNTELAAVHDKTSDKDPQKIIEAIKFKIAVMFNNSTMIARYNTNMRPFKSIYERITGKEGQFRKHVVSKRADKTARTVISPNPLLKLHELQIPLEIANTLTIFEHVSNLNIDKAQKLFDMGDIKVIQKRNTNFQIDAQKYKAVSGNNLEIGDIYWRNLQEGDWVLFNRQPTLHAPSMQAMQIKIGIPKTFSFNLANCPSYNADMDGDEMNIHVPQSIEAITEMIELSSPANWLLSEAHGGVMFGLVQDALLAIYLMSKTIPNAKIFKDAFAGINYSSKNIIIRDGDIISGVINKAEFGYNSRGLFKHIIEVRGKTEAIKLLNMFQYEGVEWLTRRGYSIGLSDCRIESQKLNELKQSFLARYNEAKDKTQIVENFRDECSFIVKETLEHNANNSIINLIEAGSKGNWVNLTQILGIVGQQYVNNSKIQISPNDESLASQGFISSNYYEGIKPIEFFAHAIAARDAICHTSTGTSVSGYLQRKLVKMLENQVVQYDNTIRSGIKIVRMC